LVVLASHSGNRYAAWDELYKSKEIDYQYRQFARRLQHTDTVLAAAVTEGVKAAIGNGLYNRLIESYSPGEVFSFDHTEVPVFVWPGRPKDIPMKVWISLLTDWGTGFMFRPIFTQGLGGVRADPDTRSIIALVTGVLVGQEFDGQVVGGIPNLLVFDNALAHLGEAVKAGLLALPVSAHTIRLGSPWENGPTENSIGVLEKTAWQHYPGYSHHLSTRYGRSPWANNDLYTPEDLMARTVSDIARLNRTPRLARLHGMSSAEAWQASPRVIPLAPRELVRRNFLAAPRSQHKIEKNGVNFKGTWYQDGAFEGRVGSGCRLRYLPNDLSFVDVYTLDGEFLCTAKASYARSMTDIREVARGRRNQLARADRIVKAGTSRAVRLASQEEQVDEFLEGRRRPEPPDQALGDWLAMSEDLDD
jgi:putative transposase